MNLLLENTVLGGFQSSSLKRSFFFLFLFSFELGGGRGREEEFWFFIEVGRSFSREGIMAILCLFFCLGVCV